MVVISEHGPNTFRGLQGAKRFRTWFNIASIGSSVVTGKGNEIRSGLLCCPHDPLDFLYSEDPAVMNIGDLRDTKTFKAPGQVG